ncbi:MAG: multicopper oxidase domain-containing protein [Ardenticatenaceae bacterium]|nr:multicopper oxidase domain-containing protein [Ardenticatenaceae bacterium]
MAFLLVIVVGSRVQRVDASHLSTIVCTDGPTFNLETTDGYATFPDGNSIYFWGFADSDSGGAFQYPGPTLCVHVGDTVTVNLTNHLAEPVSIVFPGQMNVSASGDGGTGLFTAEAAPSGGTATYSFVASDPGTYLYESGTMPQKQIEMGLFGALVVRPPVVNGDEYYAYDDPATRYHPDYEYLLLLHEVDPELHQAVERGDEFDVTGRHDRYWTINGRSNPDTLYGNGVPWLPNQPYGSMVTIQPYDETQNPHPALIRYANAGLENHPFHPHGNHLRIIAQDGRLLQGSGGEDLSFEGFTRTVGSGQTYDLLVTWRNLGSGDLSNPNPFSSSSNPIPESPEGVSFPGLFNKVDFEDGFFSGSPYLGEQEDRLAWAIPYNECGEIYFPWHSHALNEVQNFDEGFGGMLTLWRIEPLGGCQ